MGGRHRKILVHKTAPLRLPGHVRQGGVTDTHGRGEAEAPRDELHGHAPYGGGADGPLCVAGRAGRHRQQSD